MKHSHYDIPDDELQIVEEIIDETEIIKKEILSESIGDVISDKEWGSASERAERILDEAKRLVGFEPEQSANRLYKRLETSRKKRSRRIWLYTSGAAAVIAALVFIGLGLRKDDTVHPVSEIITPTLVTTRGDDIVSLKSLDGVADNTFVVNAREIEETKDSMETSGLTTHGEVYNKIIIPRGYTYKVQLADGSIVTLNAGSELKIPVEFSGDAREVEFSGEGYFEVAKSDKPFIIKAGPTELTVYGTSFNLFYSEELMVAEAVLSEGSIGMKLDNEEIRISPNQRIQFMLDSRTSYIDDVDPDDYMAWRSNIFKYTKAPLDRIIHDIARWYGVKVELAPELKTDTYSLNLNKADDVEQLFRTLSVITDTQIKRKGGIYHMK